MGTAIFSGLTPLVIADIMRGTGRYNLAQGGIATMQGIGASVSGLVSGVVVDHFGYTATFLTLGGIAAVAVAVFAIGMPETANGDRPADGREGAACLCSSSPGATLPSRAAHAAADPQVKPHRR